MSLRWYERAEKIWAYGTVRHRIWPAFASKGFYAKSGLDVHGPYSSASDARKACADIESKEPK